MTAASIRVVSSATSAAIRASFFAPAITARDSPAASLDFTVAESIPIVVEINARCASWLTFIGIAGRTASAAARAALAAATIASACD